MTFPKIELHVHREGAEEPRELHGVDVRLTPDIYRGATEDEAGVVVAYAAKYRDRGVVAVGLGGLEPEYPPEDAATRERLGRIGEDYDWGSLT